MTPPPLPTGKKSRIGWIVAGVVAAVFAIPLLVHFALLAVAAVWVMIIVPPPQEKKVDFIQSEQPVQRREIKTDHKMNEEIQKLKDSLDEKGSMPETRFHQGDSRIRSRE